MQTVSMALIVRNSEKTIKDCIESFVDVVDQVVVVLGGKSTDSTEAILKELQEKYPIIEIYPFEWCDDFAAARNYSFSKVKSDWVMWVDSDDIIHNASRIKTMADSISPQVGAIWLPYHYAIDEFGNPTTVYERERILRFNCGWVWQGRVHETTAPLTPCQYVRTDEILILHRHLTGQPRGERNFKLLHIMEKEDPNDKRIWLYLGHQHFAGQNWDKAAEYYLKFGTDKETVPLERWQALCYCSRAMREFGDAQSVDVALMAIDLFPEYRDGYLELAHSYYRFNNYDKAIHFAKMANDKELIKDPPALIFVNPLDYTFNRLCLLADCYLRKTDLKTALQYFQDASKYRPIKEVQDAIANVNAMIRRTRVDDAVKVLAVELYNNKEYSKLPSLINAIPYWYRDLPEFAELLAGSQKYTSNLRNITDSVSDGERSVVVNIGSCLDPIGFLKGIDKNNDHVTVIAPMPGNDSKQINTYAQRDIEEIIASNEGRHLINLQREEKRIFIEYDKKMPTGLIVKIFTGPGYETWNPKKIIEVGEGGSETSAAWVSKELAARNCQPVIYASDNQVWDGVLYRNSQQFNPIYPPCDLFISSRIPDIFNTSINAEKKMLWVHDIHCGDRLSPEVASNIDAIIPLSKWHAKHLMRTYPFLKECEIIDMDGNIETAADDKYTPNTFYDGAKCFRLPKMAIIGDAILTERYKEYSNIKKHPHRFIWLSSPDRGLEQLLNMWPLIRKSWADAELKIYYGWNYFDNTLFIPAQRDLKSRLRELIKQEGVEWCGRIGQNELAIREMEASFLVYPPPHDFRETYGIAFLECQAAGVVCFYRPTGALGETLGSRGVQLPMEMKQADIVERIISTGNSTTLCNTLREMGRDYAMQRTWGKQTEKILALYKSLGGIKSWQEST